MDSTLWLTILVFAMICSCSAITVNNGTWPEQVHLSLADNSTITVTWITQQATQQAIFQYSLSSSFSDYQTITGSSTEFFDFPLPRRFYIHKATTLALPASTRYYYRVGDPFGGWSSVFSFVSLPDQSTPVRYGVYADFGYVNHQSLDRLINETQAGHFDVILHVGDIGYNLYDNDSTVGDMFMNLIQPIAAYVPYQVCPGNHESDVLATFYNYKKRFNMPGSHENMFYSIDIGPVHFVSISTEHYFWFPLMLDIPLQYAWLEADLAAANLRRNITPWIVMYGHRPMYCSDDSLVLGGASGLPGNETYTDCTSDALRLRDGIEGLFGVEQLLWKYGVDLYLCGHEHSYERFWPVYQSTVYNSSSGDPYTDPRAPVHILSGAAGNQEFLDGFGASGPWTAFRSATYGYAHMTVHNGTHLQFQQILDSNGTVLDEVWLVQHNHGPFSSSAAADSHRQEPLVH